MKQHRFVFVAVLSLLAACTNYQEADVPDALRVDATELSFTSGSATRSVTVQSGTRWTVGSKPEWVSVQTINSSSAGSFQWGITFAVSENTEYDREGVITINSGSGSANIAVSQQGKKGKYVAVESVSVSPSSLSITVGDKAKLSAIISPSNASEQAVTWSSGNESLATVDQEGNVTAVAQGRVSIYATTKDGNGNKVGICSVTVNAKVISVTGVSLDKNTLTLTEGETATLTATVAPADATNKDVTWSSSNTNVATVSTSGVVTAKTAGSATITVTTADGAKKATCSVTVNAKTVAVTGVSLDKSTMTLTEGETSTLTATVAPANATNKDVTWSSNNTNVATVSTSGVVTAKAAGSATITVTTVDGSKKATCVVTVSAAVIPVTNVSLDITSLTMGVGETYTLVATIYPPDATDLTIYWSSSDTSIATVDYSGVVTAHAVGSATITFYAGGKSATCTITVINRIYNVPISSYISNYWNSDMSATYCNVKVPFYVGDDDPAHCVFANNLNAPFICWPINSEGVPGILKLNPSILKIKYFFCSTSGHGISAPRINGKTVRFTIKSEGQELWANNGGSDQLIATIINDENADVPNIITLNQASTLAKDLLNTQQLYVNIGAVGLTSIDDAVTITFNGQDHFRADFVRPISLSDIAADKFIDGVPYGEKGTYIRIEDIISPSDWRSRQFSNYPNLWGFYGPFVVNIDLGNVKCDLGGSIDTIPSYLELTLVTYDDMAYIVTDPVEYRKLKATQFGYITYKNNGQVSNSAFNLYLNMTVDYGWGTIVVPNVKVPVSTSE